MSAKTMLFCVFLFIPLLTGISLSREYLGIVDSLATDTIKSHNLLIIEQLRGRSLAILSERDICFLTQNNYSYSIIDTNPRAKELYLVFPLPSARIEPNFFYRILFDFGDCLLLSVDKRNVEMLLRLPAEFNRIPQDPMHVSAAGPAWLKSKRGPHGPDPIIQEILSKVSQDSIVASILWLQNVGTRYAKHSDMPNKVVPWVVGKLKEYGCDSVCTVATPGYNAPNVIGVKHGTKYPSSSRYAVLGAHIDAMPETSANKGADDNATGTACVLEAARVLKKYRFEHTIKFIGFNVEELGLCGSGELAKKAKDDKDTILALINIEMCGHVPTGQTGYIAVTPKKSVPGTTDLANLFIETAGTYTEQQCYFDPTEVTNSDHASYWRYGFCAIKLREKIRCSAYHTKADTLGNPNGLNSPRQVTETMKISVATICRITKVDAVAPVQAAPAPAPSFRRVPIRVRSAATTAIVVRFRENEPFFITLHNACGQKIMTLGPYSFSRGMPRIDVGAAADRSMANGVYVIELKSGSAAASSRILWGPR